MRARERQIRRDYPFHVTLPRAQVCVSQERFISPRTARQRGEPYGLSRIAQVVRQDIQKWLRYSIGRNNYRYMASHYGGVLFAFRRKEHAALFKLFWYE